MWTVQAWRSAIRDPGFANGVLKAFLELPLVQVVPPHDAGPRIEGVCRRRKDVLPAPLRGRRGIFLVERVRQVDLQGVLLALGGAVLIEDADLAGAFTVTPRDSTTYLLSAQRGEDEPMGERGAHVADTVGHRA